MAALLSLPASFEETFAALDGLLAGEEARRQSFRARFEALNALQQQSSAPESPPIAATGPAAGVAAPRRSVSAPPVTPFGVELPQRTTHGGSFGPKVRNRLIQEALAKRGGW